MEATPLENLEFALSIEGTKRVPAVICYEGIFIRDHWAQLSSYPWWYRASPVLAQQTAWRAELYSRTDYDWYTVPLCHTQEKRKHLRICLENGGPVCADDRTGDREHLSEPQIGGWAPDAGVQSIHPQRLADTPEQINHCIDIPQEWHAGRVRETGQDTLARQLQAGVCRTRYPIYHVGSPLWSTYSLWGFEGMMTMVATRPDLVKHACRRYLELGLRSVAEAAALGARAIWVEECLTDMIGAEAFRTLNVPFLTELMAEIRALGMKSIYYFCGDPRGKLESILSAGADAVSFEESKKGFSIDIESIVGAVGGRCTVLGNLDAIRVLEKGDDEELSSEIRRQLAAGRRNGNRFVMSTGSPITPDTSLERVCLYCDLVHKHGNW